MTPGEIKKLKKIDNVNWKDGKGRISYSQFSKYSACPRSWKLSYIDKLEPKGSNVDLIFGIAFHETLQTYIKMMYEDTIKKANSLDLHEILFKNIEKVILDNKKKNIPIEATSAKMAEYYHDGLLILDWFIRHRSAYFTSRQMELIGIEQPIYIQADDSNANVNIIMYIDVVLYDKKYNELHIIDLKTSKQGWKDYQKKDKKKTDQIAIYKEYYNKKYGIPLENIKPYFMIVKRKLYEGAMFAQKRFQIFEPAHGTATMARVRRSIKSFVTDCFNSDGSYNKDRDYPAITGFNEWNCTYCYFKDKAQYCDPKERKIK